jgi:hypothetical protein
MKKVTETSVREQIREQVSQLKSLLFEVEPSERLLVLNEVMTALLPDRKSVESAAEKLKRKRSHAQTTLTKAQMSLVRGMSDATDRLRDLTGDDRA